MTTPTAHLPHGLPDAIGPYRVLDRLGEGGMGDVWLCEQHAPARRRVAVKVLRRGMDSPRARERFMKEPQLLAMMDHPGIARVFDAGETADGLPYFTMEYVPGVALADYCRERQAGVHERVMLLIETCKAVQHAHQKGVIHLDLKPSNILVADVDGKPQPKIIDFGIARATAELAAEDGFVASPGYMSPELAQAGRDVDTRSDIYSLGVILYELLAGRTPHLPDDRAVSLSELQRILRTAPPSPSDAIRAQRDEQHAVRCGGATVRGLLREVANELDWITLKALSRNPSQRYASAAELAADLARFLACRPVSAARPSRLYALRKLGARHRGASAMVTLLAATLIGFTLYSGWQAQLLASERDRARREARKANEITEFMIDLFALGNPIAGFGRDLTVRRALDIGLQQAESDLADQPEVRAELLLNIARMYNGIGQHEQAHRLLSRELARTAEASPLREALVRELLRARTGKITPPDASPSDTR